jgi:hypothetical protein
MTFSRAIVPRLLDSFIDRRLIFFEPKGEILDFFDDRGTLAKL